MVSTMSTTNPTQPGDTCTWCIAAGALDNPVHFRRRQPVDDSYNGLPVHKACKRDLQSAEESFPRAHFDSVDGCWRWDSNNQIPFPDMLNSWAALGLIPEFEAHGSIEQRKVEDAAFVAEYRAAWKPPTDPEQIAEMVNAFGPGAKVVDVIAGREFTLPK